MNKPSKNLFTALFALFVFPSISSAQVLTQPINSRSIVDSNAVALPTEIFDLRPNTVSGPEFELELPDGLSCTSENGTPPSLNFYGASTRRDNSYQAFPDFVTGGHSVGAVLSVPLSNAKSSDCNEAYDLYLISKKLELLESLYDTGILSEDQVQSLSIKSLKELGFDVEDLDRGGDVGDANADSFENEDFEPEPFIVGP